MIKKNGIKSLLLLIVFFILNCFMWNMIQTLESSLEIRYEAIDVCVRIILIGLFDLVAFVLVRKSKSVQILTKELFNNKDLIWNLAKNDFKTKYVGSYLGVIWAFIQPVVTIVIYWFVFEFGLRASSPTEGVPFVLWFATGLIPWFFFSDALISATNCMIEYSYLVKKIVFKISIIPIVKIISGIFIHFVFVVFLILLFFLYGYRMDIYCIQIVYYSFCAFFLVLACSYATSAVILFFRDLGQLITILLQMGMWMTPIMWSYTIIPSNYRWIAKLNPMFYIVEGYRDALINHVWFWERYMQTMCFWIVAISLFILGTIIFKKLKIHFADVL